MVVIFALALVLMISMAGLLIDGGLAEVTRRDAQAAADTAALAAAKAISQGANGTAAAQTLGATNGFPTSTTDCSGNAITGVIVNNPPLSGPNAGVSGYVEVIAQRPMRTAFSGIVGQGCWMVSARAVAAIDSSAVAPCNFCSLNASNQNHTLLLQNSATLRVDGEIYVDSSNGGTTDPCNLNQWNVCGDAFDIFGPGGSISAKTISTVGGWETHNNNIATADQLDTVNGAPCPEYPNPPAQTQTANVCIHMPVLVDPLDNPASPAAIVQAPTAGARPVAGQNGCPSTAVSGVGTVSSPSLLMLSSGTPTICPGTYYGGIKINGGSVMMEPGVYNIAGGGFQVSGSASVDGSAGVMIYNASLADEGTSTNPGSDHVPAPKPGLVNPGGVQLQSSNPNSNPGDTVTYTMTVDKGGGSNVSPTGTVDFYDSNTVICAAVPLVSAGGTRMSATCSQTYNNWGTHAISSVYSGDSIYNAAGGNLTQTIKAPGGGNIGPLSIITTGSVKLYAPTAGQYGGLTIFQDRNANQTVQIQPGTGSAPTCAANFMTAIIIGPTAQANGCGAIGGIQGTIYAPNQNALVLITASGLSVTQVVAGKVEIDSGANARFAFNASVFAEGRVHLVE